MDNSIYFGCEQGLIFGKSNRLMKSKKIFSTHPFEIYLMLKINHKHNNARKLFVV